MSRLEQREVHCRSCHTRLTIFAWLVIDAAQYPDLKRQLLNGHMNVAPCPNCSRPCTLDVPVLYRDAILGFAVQFIPPEHRFHPNFLSMCSPDGQIRVPPAEGDGGGPSAGALVPHIVFAMEEMRWYVAFRDRISIYARPGYR